MLNKPLTVTLFPSVSENFSQTSTGTQVVGKFSWKHWVVGKCSWQQNFSRFHLHFHLPNSTHCFQFHLTFQLPSGYFQFSMDLTNFTIFPTTHSNITYGRGIGLLGVLTHQNICGRLFAWTSSKEIFSPDIASIRQCLNKLCCYEINYSVFSIYERSE